MLTLIHVLVPSTRQTLVSDHTQLDPLPMWTSARVYLDGAHLRANLLGYGIAVITGSDARIGDQSSSFCSNSSAVGVVT